MTDLNDRTAEHANSSRRAQKSPLSHARDGSRSRLVTLSLRRVAVKERWLARLILLYLAYWSAILLIVATGRARGASAAVVPSGLAICAGFMTYGLVASAAYLGSQRKGWKYGRVVRVTVALWFAEVALALQVSTDSNGLRHSVARLCGSTIVSIAVVVAVRAARGHKMSIDKCVQVGVGSALLLIAQAALQPELLEFSIGGRFAAAVEMDNDPILGDVIAPLALAAPIYILLGIAAWSLFTVRLGLLLSKRTAGHVPVLVFLYVKCVWIALTLFGVLPSWLRGHSESWQRAIARQGRWSWVLATIFALSILTYVALLTHLPKSGERAGGARRSKPDIENALERPAARLSTGVQAHLVRLLERLQVTDKETDAGLDQADGHIRTLVWVLSVPAVMVAVLTLLNSVQFGVSSEPGTLVGGIMIAVALGLWRGVGPSGWRLVLAATCVLSALLVVLIPWRNSPSFIVPFLQLATGIELNYAFFVGALGLIAPLVAIFLASRVKATPRRRWRARRRILSGLSSVGVWTAVLLPVGIFFVTLSLRSFPVKEPTSASFHIFNLFPTPADFSYMLSGPLRGQPGWAGLGGTVNWITVDTILTAFLLLYGTVLASGLVRERRYSYRPLMVVAVCSTLVAHSSTLSPVSWGTGAWLYCAAVFPAFYDVLFNSRETSRQPGSIFSLLTLNATAVATLAVAVVTTRSFFHDDYSLDNTVFGYASNFGASFFVYPFAMTYLFCVLISWRRARR
jgi:hypothetical protein